MSLFARRLDSQHALTGLLRLDRQHLVGRDETRLEPILRIAKVRRDLRQRLVEHANRLGGGHQRPVGASDVQPQIVPQRAGVAREGGSFTLRRPLERREPAARV